METKTILNVIALIGLTLTGIFIQISNERINSFSTGLVFDMQSALHKEHVALSNLLTLIGYDTRELVGDYPSYLDINASRKKELNEYLENVNDSSLRGIEIERRLENPLFV